MPKGVNFPQGLKSWSAPLVPRRLLPPRENGPIRTGALASQERRRVSSERAASVRKLSAAEVDQQIRSLKGKVVLINFWATWCPPCRMEIPGFVDLQGKYGPKGLQILGLSLDDKSPADVETFAQKNKMNYPVHIVGADTTRAWGNFEAIPQTFLLDAQGKKVWQHEGYAEPAEFEKQIKPLLSSR